MMKTRDSKLSLLLDNAQAVLDKKEGKKKTETVDFEMEMR